MNASHIRRNTVTGECVLFAPGRAARPHTVPPPPSFPPKSGSTGAPSQRRCPFCPGAEERDLEIVCWPATASDAWRVRIVRNRFPALTPYTESGATDDQAGATCGAHDVVVPTPVHATALALMSTDELAAVLRVAAARCEALAQGEEGRRPAFVTLFENHGARAGASLAHPHLQILAPAHGTPAPRLARWWTHTAHTPGPCPMCAMLAAELAHPASATEGARVVLASPHFVALVPRAAATPYGLWVVPRAHAPDFWTTLAHDSAVAADLAAVWRTVLRALRRLHGDPDYNCAFVAAPLAPPEGAAGEDAAGVRARMHWYMLFDVRVNQPAGFELVTGLPINPVLPEQAAQALRDTIAVLRDEGDL